MPALEGELALGAFSKGFDGAVVMASDSCSGRWGMIVVG